MQQNSPQGKPIRKTSGASIALILVCVIGLLGLLGFFVFNYSRIFGSQREAQTAIDAAALQAAKDVSNVWILTDLGQIGMTDQAPGPNNNSTAVEGINTALATARLDYLIASDLNNPSMQVLARRDLEYLQNVVEPQLQSAVSAQLGSIQQDAMSVYSQNAARDYRNGKAAVNTLTLAFGTFTNTNAGTSIRIPDGSLDGLNSNNVQNLGGSNPLYKANVPVPIVPGYAGSIFFGAIGDSPRIVDNGDFSNGSSGSMLPTAVQVTAASTLDGAAGTSNTSVSNQKVTNIATAICGSGIVTNTSTTYCISFPSGFPSDPTFLTPVGILNSASISSATSGTTINNTNSTFNALPSETWFAAPAHGYIPPGPMVNQGFTAGFTKSGQPIARKADYPPIALAFGLYDWIRSMGLRVDRHSMVDALGTRLDQFISGNQYTQPIQISWDGLSTPAYASSPVNLTQNSIMLSLPPMNSTTAMDNDPRENAVLTMGGGDNNGVALYANSFGYEFPGNIAPKTAAAVLVTPTGAQTMDGKNVWEMSNAQTAVVSTNHAASCVQQAGNQTAQEENALAASLNQQADTANKQAKNDQTQITELQKQIAAMQLQHPPGNTAGLQAQIQQLTTDMNTQLANASKFSKEAQAAEAKAKLAAICAANGKHIMDQTNAIIANFQALTSVGCGGGQNGTPFTIAGSQFTAERMIAGPGGQMIDCGNAQNASTYAAQMVQNIKNAKDASDPLLQDGATTKTNSSWAQSGGAANAPNLSAYTYAGSGAQTLNGQSVPAIPAISKGPDLLVQAANAQSVQTFVNGPHNGQLTGPGLASPPNNNLMFLFNITGDYQKTSGGKVTITPLPMTPFWNNTTSNGQPFYYAPDCLTCTQAAQNSGLPLQINWSCVARDNCANGKFFNSNAEHNNNATGDKDFCHKTSYSMAMPSGDCPTLGGEFRVGCPITSATPPNQLCGADTVSSGSGSNTQPVCPPPPPQMG